ncbi:MAG: universal stress protein [Elusimicrobia bacterium]|nr:universal stress protein [Elusimicrobiota bacterium]
MSFRRILVAVDGGPLAARAAQIGLELARRLRARCAFVHVVDAREIAAPESGASAAELYAMAERDSRSLLDSFLRRAPRGARVALFSVVGGPAAAIAKTAERWSADLLVIGSHGRRGVGRLLLGSVAEGAARRAPCPILIVRGTRSRRQRA